MVALPPARSGVEPVANAVAQEVEAEHDGERMAMPGNVATHHCSISSRPSDTIEPHSGVVPPTPEWGSMVSEGRELIEQWWVATFPGIAILSPSCSASTSWATAFATGSTPDRAGGNATMDQPPRPDRSA